jgi:hypothetical protein
MPNFPSKQFFLETILPDDLAGTFTDPLRLELYHLAVAYYRAGWEDATIAVERTMTPLYYADFPFEKDDE